MFVEVSDELKQDRNNEATDVLHGLSTLSDSVYEVFAIGREIEVHLVHFSSGRLII